jgi:hypothetical protein
MLAYYDERAPEYEEAYTRGTGTASISDPEVFKVEARAGERRLSCRTRPRPVTRTDERPFGPV